MYVSDRHPDRERLLNRQSADPPVPAGETLFDFERDQGNARVRGSLEEYNGHPFVRCQTWERGTGGRWWPRRGAAVTFRLRELPELVEALSGIGPDARPSVATSPWVDDEPRPARQEPRGAIRGGQAERSPVPSPQRAVEPPRRPDDDGRPRYVERRRERRAFDPSSLPPAKPDYAPVPFDERGDEAGP